MSRRSYMLFVVVDSNRLIPHNNLDRNMAFPSHRIIIQLPATNPVYRIRSLHSSPRDRVVAFIACSWLPRVPFGLSVNRAILDLSSLPRAFKNERVLVSLQKTYLFVLYCCVVEVCIIMFCIPNILLFCHRCVSLYWCNMETRYIYIFM